MFEKLSNKKKFIYSLVLFLLIFIGIIYKKNILRISEVKEKITLSKEAYKDSHQIGMEINTLNRELNYLNSKIGEININPESVQREIIGYISENGKNIELNNVDKIHYASIQDYDIYTNSLILSGSYKDLITFLYKLEREFSLSKLINVNFYKKKNYTSRSTTLYMKLIFQNYESKE